MDDSTGHLVDFLDPQPQPGEDRVWFARSSTGTGLYAVTRTSCSCPWGSRHTAPEDKACRHRVDLLRRLDPKEQPHE